MRRNRYLRPSRELPEIVLYRAPVDCRKQAHGLALIVEQELGHSPFTGALRRKRIELTLSDEDKAGASKTFFTKVKEELEFIPAQLNVLEYWQEKAVFEGDGAESVVGAPRPAHPLGKCVATPSLLAHIITSKYADGLPLYRLETMLARLGHPLSRTSMAHWIIRLSEVFKPLINLMREAQNTSGYLQADDQYAGSVLAR